MRYGVIGFPLRRYLLHDARRFHERRNGGLQALYEVQIQSSFEVNRIVPQTNMLLLRSEDSDGRVHQVLLSTRSANETFRPDDCNGDFDGSEEPISEKARVL